MAGSRLLYSSRTSTVALTVFGQVLLHSAHSPLWDGADSGAPTRRQGAIAVSGRLDLQFAVDFLQMRCVFSYGQQWTLVHWRRADVLDALRHADAFLSRLEGEWWLRFSGE